MITLKTITTIELSSICNLKCKYCVNRLLVKHPARSAGIMSDEIFAKSVIWLKLLCENGTQNEVNINGTGESCLDPNLIKRARIVKDIAGPDRRVGFCTNGLNMTHEMAKGLRDSGIDYVDLSIHSPWHTRKALGILSSVGIFGVVAFGAIVTSHNWAGQLEPENTVDINYKMQCDPLIQGMGYISSEGWLTPCCYDYRLLGAYGHVNDKDLLNKEIKPYKLCKTCHQAIPGYILRKEAA